jgi:hypothetical protein
LEVDMPCRGFVVMPWLTLMVLLAMSLSATGQQSSGEAAKDTAAQTPASEAAQTNDRVESAPVADATAPAKEPEPRITPEPGKAAAASSPEKIVSPTLPLIILAIGIAIVLGSIIVLKINAFIALISAAMAVSVLSVALLGEGTWKDSIARVAGAFGTAAGNIGIVIGLAAVIGKCMLDSGAADRIVRAFVRLFGEKRSPLALMGSGYVLAIPVFFDTVFYLLVPLARSLYRRTQQNYLMYLLAIAAGGAITHTLVPPTPGPLVMAATLNVDVGMMILVGILVALPSARNQIRNP